MVLEVRIIVNFEQEDLNHHWENGMRRDFEILVKNTKIHMLTLSSMLFIRAVKRSREKTLPLLGGDLYIALFACETIEREELS